MKKKRRDEGLCLAMKMKRRGEGFSLGFSLLCILYLAATAYEPGMCARRLTYYMYQQQHRPEDNNIEFWRKFVAEYFAPNAKKKWCVSMYGSSSQTTGVFPQVGTEETLIIKL
ncbi:transcriptional corepressor SEUSS [Trifolium repens]|nr:transcriptional corepressor SEUSS [Trifolium repens]